jgi:hypothetical protein
VAPPTALSADGLATFHYDEETGELSYEVKVDNIEDVNEASIHLAPAKENGEKVLQLYSGQKEGIFEGTLVKGAATGNDLMGPLNGGTMQDLVNEFNDERAYIVVGNKAYPSGAIRGQIKHKPWYRFW